MESQARNQQLSELLHLSGQWPRSSPSPSGQWLFVLRMSPADANWASGVTITGDGPPQANSAGQDRAGVFSFVV